MDGETASAVDFLGQIVPLTGGLIETRTLVDGVTLTLLDAFALLDGEMTAGVFVGVFDGFAEAVD